MLRNRANRDVELFYSYVPNMPLTIDNIAIAIAGNAHVHNALFDSVLLYFPFFCRLRSLSKTVRLLTIINSH